MPLRLQLLAGDQPGRQRLLQWLTDQHRARFPEITEAERARVAREFMSEPAKLGAACAACREFAILRKCGRTTLTRIRRDRAPEAVADELFGDEGQGIAVAQLRLIRRLARQHADIVEQGPRAAWPPPSYGFGKWSAVPPRGRGMNPR